MTKKASPRQTKSAYAQLRYKVSGNPLFVWKELPYLLSGDEPLPEWTKEFLVEVANRLITTDLVEQDIGQGLKAALDIESGRVFDQFHRSEIKNKVYFRVMEERESRTRGSKDSKGGNLYEDIAGELGIGEHTVRKYFKEMQQVHKELDAFEKTTDPDKIIALFKRVFSS